MEGFMRFQDNVAVVTGAGSGIGEATAFQLAAEGATVICVGRNFESEQATAKRIITSNGRAEAVELDVADESAVQTMLTDIASRYGRLDVLVNNAGVGGLPWSKTIEVNLGGIYFGTTHAAGLMADRGGGAIVNNSSILGLVATGAFPELPDLDATAYVASKHGVVGVTRAAALRYAERGVRVNCVCPGYIETPMLSGLLAIEGMRESLESLHALRRLGRADEVARAICFLASEEASFITGVALPVDGGYTAR